MVKTVIFLLLFFAALLIGHHNAQASTYPGSVRTPALEAKLPTPVAVYCTQNTNLSFAMLTAGEIYLDLNTCGALLGGQSTISFERAAHNFLHEWWHVAAQETDEKLTECGAYASFRYLLVRYWHVKPRVAQRMYEATWLWSPYSPLPCKP